MEENKFDFKFLNKVMYIVTFIIVFFALKEVGVIDKLLEVLAALTPLYVGIVICWISNPLANKLRKLGLNKGVAAVISLIIIFAIMILALSYIIPIVGNQITDLIKDLPSLYTSAVNKINLFLNNSLGLEYQISASLGDLSFISNYIGEILTYSIDTVQVAGSILISFVTSIMITFFMVKDVDRMKNSFIVFLSKKGKGSQNYKMLLEMDGIINSYVRGLLLDSIIVGIMTTIVCMVLKLEYAIIFGILITFLNLIPYIGAVISYTITSIYAFTVGGPILAIITFIASFIIQLIDANILQPNIIGKSVKLHPVAVICGLLVFERIFGVLGMILAMPLLAIGKIFLKYKFGINFELPEENEKREKIVKKANVKKEN
ncbi:MAG: AI-2E family transporter [Clostridia bacterium]|nr:AI-2E family transporter [Clostridia bacterium]